MVSVMQCLTLKIAFSLINKEKIFNHDCQTLYLIGFV